MGAVLEGVSVIVASRNRNTMAFNLLNSLKHLGPTIEEVVMVDDGSPIPLPFMKWDIDWPFRLKVIRNDVAQGPARARNQGVHKSRGNILLFTDDDCIVEPQWAEQLTSHLDKGTKGIGGVGGRVIAHEMDIFSRYYDYNRILDPKPHDRENPERIPYLVTANGGMTREVYMKAGGFDHDMLIAGGEDVALSMKIAKLGLHFERNASAVVRHKFKPGLMQFWRTFYNYGRGGRHVVDRYLPL